MLVLTRRIDESLMLGNEVKITVLKIGATKIMLGITAPEDVAIFREEIYRPVEQVDDPDPVTEQ